LLNEPGNAKPDALENCFIVDSHLLLWIMNLNNEDGRRTIENAVLLWTLAEVPEKPAENSILTVEGEWTTC
jgi:hypothetical protein